MLKDLTDSEKQALRDLLYLVTHVETMNMHVRTKYNTLRVGNPDMPAMSEFAASLDSLYARICK